MILRYNDITRVKFKNDKAEIIVKCKYKLTIIMRKNKVVVKYPDDIVEIGFSKFNTEEIANTIYELVKNSGEFDIEVIKEVLQSLRLGYLSGKLAKKIFNLPCEEGDKVMGQLEKFLSRI